MVIITDGYNDPDTAKTALCLIRYRPGGSRRRARSAVGRQDLPGGFRRRRDIPCVGSLAEAPEANTFVVGIAPPGGKIPQHWRPIILEAIARKMTVVSGLHDFLGDDAEFRRAAERARRAN